MPLPYRDFILMVSHLRKVRYDREDMRPGVQDEILWVFCETMERWIRDMQPTILDTDTFNVVLTPLHFVPSLAWNESVKLIMEIFDIFGEAGQLTVVLTAEEFSVFGGSEWKVLA